MRPTQSFSEKEELSKFILKNNIRILNLCHIPEDGKLKTLSFSTGHAERVADVLEFGERVDGSSLFSFIDPSKSDIYVVPRLDRVFLNPFSKISTLNILCDYLDEKGKPLDVAPGNVLAKAEERLRVQSSVALKCLAELEFYVISKQEQTLFPGQPEKNYHDSAPFSRYEDLRSEILDTLSGLGIATKYGHSEVGRIFGDSDTFMEQHEIEFQSRTLAEMADTVTISKWTIRNIGTKYGVSVSFIPKISMQHAGTGMHIHMYGLRNSENIVSETEGRLSSETMEMIGGLLKLAPSLSAFGNPTPVSYLRFIARKESPMNICWSKRNRLALIRIPLWWSFRDSFDDAEACRRTFEYRAPDAFANVHLLFAAMTTAIGYGLQNPRKSLQIAEDLHVESYRNKKRRIKMLPRSCAESAENLQRDRQHYEAGHVFPERLVDRTIEKLKAYDDRELWKRLAHNPTEFASILKQYLNYG